jgi:hypothetical protein
MSTCTLVDDTVVLMWQFLWNRMVHGLGFFNMKLRVWNWELFPITGMIGMLLRPAADLVDGSRWREMAFATYFHSMYRSVVLKRCR